jgi:hypothetical protein
MIWLIIYLLGAIIVGIWGWYDTKSHYSELILHDVYEIIIACLFSWVTVAIMVNIWLKKNQNKVICRKK